MVDDYFFLSYARDDEENRTHIERFFEDLRTEIRLQEGSLGPDDPVGFRDQEGINVGDEWRPELTRALCRAKTLICLYSPRYFYRPYCGKEVQVFLQRQRAHLPAGTAKAILPVIWRKPETIPSALSPIQYDHVDLPKAYRTRGLRQLMISGQRYKRPYQDLVEWLATKIRKSYRTPLREAGDLDFENIRSAFEEGPSDQPTADAYMVQATGPQAVRFVYVAGTKSEIECNHVRLILDAYGQYRSHWNPYFSNRNDDCIWKIAVDVARQSGINPGEIDVGHDLLHELRKAKQENSLVVLIIDTWTLKLPEIKQKMREYDDTSFLNCAALVVWDESDETSEGREALANLLVEIFDDNYGTNHSHLFRPDVRSRDALVHELAETLRILKFNVINRGQPMRVIAGKNEPLPGF